MIDKFFLFLIRGRTIPIIGILFYFILKIIGVEIPLSVKLGKDVAFPHWAYGLVIHKNTEIEDDVRLYQGVTIGRADVYNDIQDSKFIGIRIASGAIIGAGAKVLGSEGVLVVGKGTIIGANSVLLESTGEFEIWAGNPARKIRDLQPIKRSLHA